MDAAQGWLSATVGTTLLGQGDPLSLPLSDELALVLGEGALGWQIYRGCYPVEIQGAAVSPYAASQALATTSPEANQTMQLINLMRRSGKWPLQAFDPAMLGPHSLA